MREEDKKELLQILESRNVPLAEQWVKEAEKYGAPSRDKALFLREVWSALLSEKNLEWLNQSIQNLEGRVGKRDLYSLRFEPENPSLLAALVELRNRNVPIEALTHVIRQGQIQVLEWVLSLIDGGHCFGDGLVGHWGMFGTGENHEPLESFGDMKDIYWLFNPERKDV